ncbi:hypothetical protein [Verticiella sediminum]|uniref:hypothetical protein n=1 Tax=Verticiella sediminum TaxID=1247510 RepID=UPI0014780726|nr:hypothetical protein [Verticiella sediminum]
MLIAFETVLVIVFLSLVALGIALLGDHVTQVLSRNDPWPTVKRGRRLGTRQQGH